VTRWKPITWLTFSAMAVATNAYCAIRFSDPMFLAFAALLLALGVDDCLCFVKGIEEDERRKAERR
jgi:predicted RND superfamily exporter protein